MKPNTFILAILLPFALLTFVACEQDNGLGADLLPADALLQTYTSDNETVKAYTLEQDSVYIKNSTYSLFGSYVDPVFGNVKAECAAQYRLLASTYEYPEDAVIISVEITIQCFIDTFSTQSVYGNWYTPMKLKIYELNEDLVEADDYFSTYKIETDDLTKYFDDDIALPHATDSVLRITMGSDFEQRIFEITSDTVLTDLNAAFLAEFKGLYFATDQVAAGGAIAAFDLKHTNSGITINYTSPSTGDTASYSIKVSDQSVRLNLFENEASDELNQAILAAGAAENIYIKPMDGCYSVFEFPDLENWIDTLTQHPKLVIERATLTLTPAVDDSRIIFEAPKDLVAYSSDTTYLSDYFDGYTNYNLYMNGNNEPFILDIGNAISDYIRTDGTEPLQIRLKSAHAASQAHRLVIDNSTENKPKLQIHYTIIGN